ncbi:hypothetical protein CDD80_5807 [Ophiocordyceps camponoti-rufipedis]|uniref:Uncharacterized protein n=1 Tax=Ophiocordyceps camponoti-rufipedis TaxID=2004952 RepID=A0A2C5ZIN3_9HYPO|nr:hypothetical protein CDD80_5807 [Ophiocordyceps camponoti-rufipedis]
MASTPPPSPLLNPIDREAASCQCLGCHPRPFDKWLEGQVRTDQDSLLRRLLSGLFRRFALLAIRVLRWRALRLLRSAAETRVVSTAPAKGFTGHLLAHDGPDQLGITIRTVGDECSDEKPCVPCRTTCQSLRPKFPLGSQTSDGILSEAMSLLSPASDHTRYALSMVVAAISCAQSCPPASQTKAHWNLSGFEAAKMQDFKTDLALGRGARTRAHVYPRCKTLSLGMRGCELEGITKCPAHISSMYVCAVSSGHRSAQSIRSYYTSFDPCVADNGLLAALHPSAIRGRMQISSDRIMTFNAVAFVSLLLADKDIQELASSSTSTSPLLRQLCQNKAHVAATSAFSTAFLYPMFAGGCPATLDVCYTTRLYNDITDLADDAAGGKSSLATHLLCQGITIRQMCDAMRASFARHVLEYPAGDHVANGWLGFPMWEMGSARHNVYPRWQKICQRPGLVKARSRCLACWSRRQSVSELIYTAGQRASAPEQGKDTCCDHTPVGEEVRASAVHGPTFDAVYGFAQRYVASSSMLPGPAHATAVISMGLATDKAQALSALWVIMVDSLFDVNIVENVALACLADICV